MSRKTTYSMFGNLRPQDLRALGVGLELAMVIGGLAYGGHYLDETWGTDPWLLLTGVIVGTLGGGWHALKMANGGKVPDFGLSPKNKKTVAGDDVDEMSEDKKTTP